jgi:polyisoprenoid-binding protein YceI
VNLTSSPDGSRQSSLDLQNFYAVRTFRRTAVRILKADSARPLKKQEVLEMNAMIPGAKAAALLYAASLCFTPAARAEPHKIDTAKSTMTIRVYKAGVFSALGHNHTISAPLRYGVVDSDAHRVEVTVNAAALRVRDPDVSEKDRAEIQNNMLGPEVLDAERHQEIAFRSTGVEAAGPGAWTVRGNLTLHGETKPVTLEVRETNGRYEGNARLRQSDFGIKPVKVAGGTVRVKDEVRIEFEIQLAR